MPPRPHYALQPFVRQNGALRAGELLREDDEDRVFKRGKAMSARVAGMVFFKITTSAEGDEWAEIEMICTDGEVPREA